MSTSYICEKSSSILTNASLTIWRMGAVMVRWHEVLKLTHGEQARGEGVGFAHEVGSD